MSVITKVEIQKKDDTRANVYLDDVFYAGLSIETVMKNHIKKGLEIESQELDRIILEDEKIVATNKAMKYLSGTLKTKKQIRDYLKKKEYSTVTINYVIDKMIEYGFLDDQAYVRAFALTNSSKYGRLRIVNSLRAKGVAQKDIDEVLTEDFELKDSIDSVAEKYFRGKTYDEKNYSKLTRFLLARGYDYDDIRPAVEKIKRGNIV